MPMLLTCVISAVMAGMSYPFAVVLFVSVVPVILSINAVVNYATRASLNKSVTDGKFLGKIGSAVECRPVIRVCNAGEYVENDTRPLREEARDAHFKAFFGSGLANSSFDVFTCGYVSVDT